MGLPVAVKKLDETGLQGREEFFREVEASHDRGAKRLQSTGYGKMSPLMLH